MVFEVLNVNYKLFLCTQDEDKVGDGSRFPVPDSIQQMFRGPNKPPVLTKVNTLMYCIPYKWTSDCH